MAPAPVEPVPEDAPPAPPLGHPADSAPPAPAAGDDLRCPLCEYDLRGLVEPRCPECGYRFEWADVTDPARRLHPYLFEHHPERNASSFVQTHLRGWRPKRFWTSLLPAQPGRLRRLLVYFCVVSSLLVPVMVAHYALWARDHAARMEVERNRWIKQFGPGHPFHDSVAKQFGSIEAWLEQSAPRPPSSAFFERAFDAERGWTLLLAGILLAWPVATFLALLVFRISMRRARIKPVHVLRCVVYSFDVIGWAALAAGAAVLYRAAVTWADWPPREILTNRFVPTPPLPRSIPFSYRPDVVPDALFWLLAAAVLLSAYRLASAFRHYLKFDHPVSTVVASQVIVVLAAVVVALQLMV